MNCVIHKEKEAAGVCTYCGKPFCEDCMVEIQGRLCCKNDINNLTQAPSSGINFNKNNNNSNSNYNNNNHYNNNSNIDNTQQRVETPNYNNPYLEIPRKDKVIAILLCFFGGYLGIHRFYVGKVGTGIIWFLTGGVFGMGWIIDIILIATDAFKDSYGRPLV